PWRRITGSTHLHARNMLLRFTVWMRSQSSSRRCTGPESPAPIPTLLCNTSIRPNRSRHASVIARQPSRRDTSATAIPLWPPSETTCAWVSRADDSSRSTIKTRAPSRANSNAVARPLPIVSPGVCPAPVTIATFPSSRPTISESLYAFVELDSQAVEHHRHQVVLTDGKHDVHQLGSVVAHSERGPRGIADERVLVELVRGAHERRLERIPAGCVGALADASEVVVPETGA